jgi:hypothetical protein
MKTIKLLSAILALAAFTACDSAEDPAAAAAETPITETVATPPSTPAPATAKASCDKCTDHKVPAADVGEAESLERAKKFAVIDSVVKDDAQRLAALRTTAPAPATANDPMIAAPQAQPAVAAAAGLPAQKIPVKITLPFLQQPPQGQLQAGTVTINFNAPAGMTVTEVMAMTKAEEIKLQQGGYGIDKTTRKMVKLPPNHPAITSRTAKR